MNEVYKFLKEKQSCGMLELVWSSKGAATYRTWVDSGGEGPAAEDTLINIRIQASPHVVQTVVMPGLRQQLGDKIHTVIAAPPPEDCVADDMDMFFTIVVSFKEGPVEL